MLPLSLLYTSRQTAILAELKSGETYNGILVSCDSWMNLNLRDVVSTSKDGDEFFQLKDCFIKGTMLKYVRVSDEVVDKVREYKNSREGGRGRESRGRGRPY